MADQGIVQCKPFLLSLYPLKSAVPAETLGFAELKRMEQAHIPPDALSAAVSTLGRSSWWVVNS